MRPPSNSVLPPFSVSITPAMLVPSPPLSVFTPRIQTRPPLLKNLRTLPSMSSCKVYDPILSFKQNSHVTGHTEDERTRIKAQPTGTPHSPDGFGIDHWSGFVFRFGDRDQARGSGNSHLLHRRWLGDIHHHARAGRNGCT